MAKISISFSGYYLPNRAQGESKQLGEHTLFFVTQKRWSTIHRYMQE